MGEWSTDTRDLVAATIAAHVDRIGAIDLTQATYCGCSCGEAFAIPLPPRPIPGHWLLEVWLPAFRAHRADAVLTALTEAGALLPAGGRVSDEWQVTYQHNCHPTLAGISAGPCRTVPHREVWMTAISEADARRGLATCRDEANWPEPRIETRTVTTWPTSSVYYGPWREVADG